MSIESVAPYLAGPGAGLLVCLLVGAGIYKLVATKIVPLIEGAVNRHLKQIDDMAERHAAEHTAILESLSIVRQLLQK
jgi:hypothetical protein